MINNRQNGRRRGRGGQQQARNGQPGNVDRGNRIDNRARGNAAQLLEKYKNLARDAQMQGDRVNTEYYLQFADHYFRVLSESRARFEEQRGSDPREQQQQQQRYRRDEFRDEFGPDGDDDGSRDENGEQNWNDGDDDRGPAQNDRVDRPERTERPVRAERQERRPRYEEQPAEAAEADAEQPPQQQQRAEGERRPRRQRAPRDGANGFGHAANEEGAGTGPVSERIEIDRLPQALSPAPSNDDGDGDAVAEDEAPRPRRRAPRRPRAEAAAES